MDFTRLSNIGATIKNGKVVVGDNFNNEMVLGDTIIAPDKNKSQLGKRAFANALSSGGQQLAKSLSNNDYQFTPSRVDYSQFMGLSPETQRYLYGRL